MTHIKITDESKAIAASPVGAQDPDDPDYWIPFVAHASETTVLEEVENMEERVYTASLQVKVSAGTAHPVLFVFTRFSRLVRFECLARSVIKCV